MGRTRGGSGNRHAPRKVPGPGRKRQPLDGGLCVCTHLILLGTGSCYRCEKFNFVKNVWIPHVMEASSAAFVPPSAPDTNGTAHEQSPVNPSPMQSQPDHANPSPHITPTPPTGERQDTIEISTDDEICLSRAAILRRRVRRRERMVGK